MTDNHIIVAAYDGGGYTKTRPAYQYDYGQVLRLEDFGDLLPGNFEMHFSIGNGQAITRIGTNGDVEIPNVCLERYGTVTAWLFLHDTVNDGETKYVIETPVRSRGKTTDQEPTPQEQSVITQTIAALNGGVTAAEAAQEAAEAAAESIMNAGAEATTLSPGSPATASVTNEDGVIMFHLGIPKGERGDQIIDDTAGSGNTDVVWSADKSTAVAGSKVDKADTVLDTTLSRGRNVQSNAGQGSIAFGYSVVASGDYSQAVGEGTTAIGYAASAEGYQTEARNSADHAEGLMTLANGGAAHSEGFGTMATGSNAHAEGNSTTASGSAAHADGENTNAAGSASSAHGVNTTATGYASVAEGIDTVANGNESHAQGEGTIAQAPRQHVSGMYNVADMSQGGQYAEIVGNGSGDSNRSNAYALGWNGDGRFAGDVYVGCGTDSTGGSKLAKESQIPDVSGKLDKPNVAGATGQVLTSNGRGGQTWQTPATVPQIDDTAGTGDTGKVWSANKIVSEISSLSGELDDKYEKPATGIPATDLASGVIPDVSGKQNAPATAGTAGQVLGLNNSLEPVWMDQSSGPEIDDTAGSGDTTKVWSADKNERERQTLNSALNDKLDSPETAGTQGQVLTSDGQGGQSWETPSGGDGVDEWELLYNVTTASETTGLSIDLPNLKELYFWYHIPVLASGSATSGFDFKVSDGITTELIYHVNNGMHTNGQRYFRLWAKKIGPICFGLSLEDATSSINMNMNAKFLYEKYLSGAINNFQLILSISSAIIPANSEFKLWGVRE